jgi:hypothetical protein
MRIQASHPGSEKYSGAAHFGQENAMKINFKHPSSVAPEIQP